MHVRESLARYELITATLLVLGLAVGGCFTRNPSFKFPQYSAAESTPSVDRSERFGHPVLVLDKYRSAQERIPGAQDPELAVAVAISGGGQRAANFAIGVLLGLEKLVHKTESNRNALREIDYFSTVSGGGMAAGAYIGSMYSHISLGRQPADQFEFAHAMQIREKADANCGKSAVAAFYARFSKDNPDELCDPCLLRHLERGYHNNIAESLTSPRVWFSSLDRGDLLERAFAEEVLGGKWHAMRYENGDQADLNVIRLGDIFIPKSSNVAPTYPFWICNATVFENGAIFPFTPDILEQYAITGYVHDMEIHEECDPSRELLEEFYRDMPLSVGMAASGTFPSLIAAQTLLSSMDPVNPYVHLLDGGLADNLGVFTALEVLRQDTSAKRKVLIVVDAFPGEFAPYSKKAGAPNAPTTYRRLATLPLNSWRGRLRHALNNSMAGNVETVYLSFDDLSIDREGREDTWAETRSEQLYERLIDEFGFDPEATYSTSQPARNKVIREVRSEMATKTPWELARGVDTTYNVSAWEQSLLIAAGRFVVDEKSDYVRRALFPE